MGCRIGGGCWCLLVGYSRAQCSAVAPARWERPVGNGPCVPPWPPCTHAQMHVKPCHAAHHRCNRMLMPQRLLSYVLFRRRLAASATTLKQSIIIIILRASQRRISDPTMTPCPEQNTDERNHPQRAAAAEPVIACACADFNRWITSLPHACVHSVACACVRARVRAHLSVFAYMLLGVETSDNPAPQACAMGGMAGAQCQATQAKPQQGGGQARSWVPN